jgi:hypothetical protein
MPRFSLSQSPEGMTVNANSGVVKWIPSTPGSFDVTLIAENEAGQDAQQFTIVVAKAFFAPTITSQPLTQSTANQPYQYRVQADGNPAPVFSLENAPDGMTIDSAEGLIQWTPTQDGVFELAIEAPTSKGRVMQSCDISVYSQFAAPAWSSNPGTQALAGLD